MPRLAGPLCLYFTQEMEVMHTSCSILCESMRSNGLDFNPQLSVLALLIVPSHPVFFSF